mmetsp:Transcript_19329/g.39666  ORF Transcript_19329/g.39666 Transcript_19329/m.39666 type:complete len:546 (-) Transcript_19329:456-2093(-)|eukprot:CAMPEP_0201117590 /NCGR_PEP_ID=MMETSP0850-20130426/1562_1 /ASSEMBLY_ACC=CAM_ASM_000622 /TAXON_ID=183588 /ORGANISM="Pseudo-nitzschia fraudulenta, Strain WWA7" /LENGTH=545 /DNA_ID=CAMNT_0047382029 /DNA_START=405 /DNA_END=2042 /DNA_ORIENTATION=+
MTAGSNTNGKNNHRPVMAMMGGVAVHRIRTPNQEDVLCGRGGGINSHAGNKVFRAWVTERKRDYNLAPNKQEKTQVAMEVVRRIQNQSPRPGRFLRKDPSIQGGQTWWVVCEESKALAKTTQALREGAPRIRQAHENATGNTSHTGAAAAGAAAASSRPVKTNKKRKRNPATASARKPPPPSEDAAEKLVLQTVRQNASSLSGYKSEHLFLPASDYIAVAMNQLQENAEKAKQQASRESQRAEAHHQQKLPYEEQNIPDREQQTPYYQEQTMPAHAAAAPTRPLVAPLTSNRAFNHIYGHRKDMVRSKKSKANPLALPAVDPFAETPPLTAAPEPDVADGIPVLSLDRVGFDRVFIGDAPAEPAQKRRPLKRENSLALSDSGWSNADGSDGCPFVNPFADESDILENGNNPTLAKLDVSSSEYNQVFKGEKSENQATGGERKNGTVAYSRSASTFGSSVNVLLNSILSLSSFVVPSNDSEPASGSGIAKEGGGSTLEDQNNNNNLNNNTDYFFDDVQVGDDAGGSFSPFYHGIFGGKRHPSSSKK